MVTMRSDADKPVRPHLYAHLGISMGPTGDLTAEARMPVADDVRTPGGIRAALLALLIEGGFGGNFLQAGLFPVLDNMTVHIGDRGTGVAAAWARGEIVRRGNQRAVARGQVVDADDPGRTLAHATIGYWMIKPRGDYMPSERASPPAAVRPSTPAPILEVMDMHVTGVGVCELEFVHDGVLAPEGRLHGGAHQLMHEAAALARAEAEMGTDRVRVDDFSIRFLAPAFQGPFVATATTLARSPTDVLCQVELIDRGANDQIRSLSTIRISS